MELNAILDTLIEFWNAQGQIILAGFMAAAGAIFIAYGARAQFAPQRIQGRLKLFSGPSAAPVATASHVDENSPVVRALAGLLLNVAPKSRIEQTRTKLKAAGLPSERHLENFFAAQVGLAGLGLLFCLALVLPGMMAGTSTGAGPLVFALGAVALGYYAPQRWLQQRTAQRRRAVLLAMPDMLDLLTISLSAGLGFQGGLTEVARRATGPMAQELNTVLRDIRLGHTRREALRSFASRVSVDEITNFVAAILQAEELGSPLREALRAQATQLRAARRLRAEERARKSTVVMLLPMMMFIFPALFVVLVGPAVPSFIPMFTRQVK